MKVNKYELIEFFGVLPEINEEDCYELYRIKKDNRSLKITFSYSSGFSLLLFSNNSSDPIFSTGTEGEIKIKRVASKNNYDCLELTVPFLKRFGEADWNHSYTVRIFIEPDIKVEIL